MVTVMGLPVPMKHRNSGFTLIELLVVLFIIGVLTGVLLPNFMSARQRGRDAQRKQDLQQIKTALRLYYNDHQTYPPASAFSFGSEWEGYMAKVPQDPLGGGDHSYGYCVFSDGEGFVLWARLENAADSDIAASQTQCPADGCGGAYNCEDPETPESENCYHVCAN